MSPTSLSSHRVGPALVFLSGLALIYAVAWYVVEIPEFSRRDALAFGVTADLTLTIPALYYLLMVRRAGLPHVSLIPVFIASLLVAASILPDDRERFLTLVEYAGVGAEMFLVGYVIHRGLRFGRRVKGHSPEDLVVEIRRTLRDLLGESRLVHFASAEATILYFAFFSWRRTTPEARPGSSAFSYHRNSGWSSMLLVLGFFMAVELFFVHILLSRWSPVAAWILSGLSLYGLIWMVGDYRALCLRPVILGARTLYVRVGLRWEAEIPLESIEEIRFVSYLEDPPPGYLNAAVLKQPSVLIHLKREASATGLFGMRRRYRVLGLSIDQPAAFRDRVLVHQVPE